MISVCLIAKNEEKNIEHCLASLANRECEIVLVDTGSVDKTIEIAGKYTDKIYHFPWINDFSAAKNYCISKASNDEILFIDCDEYWDEENSMPFENIEVELDNHSDEIGSVIIRNFFTKDGMKQESQERVGRIFDRRRFKYQGAVHEQLVSTTGLECQYFLLNVYLGHTGYDLSEAEKKAKAERNIDILLKEIEQTINNQTERNTSEKKQSLLGDLPYLYYQLGKSYYSIRDYENAELYFGQALTYDVNPELTYVKDLVETYGYTLLEQKKYEEALALEGVYEEFADTADFLFLMGLIYMNNALFDQAVENFEKATTKSECKVVGTNSYKAFYNIGVIYECLGEKKSAIENYRKCGDYSLALGRLDNLRMKFEHAFFLDEVREGFYVSGQMKRFWAAQLEVLEDIDTLCKKHNIKWFADYGTLMGVVRHGGYIPWDDDLDICMLRNDYDRFREIARRELPENYSVLDAQSDNYWSQVIRITNARDVIVGEEFLRKYHNFPYPAGIDVFGLDNLSDDEEEEKRRSELVRLVMTAAVSCELAGELTEDEREILTLIEESSGQKLDYEKPLRNQLYALGENLYRLFQDTETKYVAQMSFYLENGSHRYLRKMFSGDYHMAFENMKMPVPIDGIGKLKADYGDFMKISRKGGIHEYPLFQHNEDLFIEYLEGKYPFVYKFKSEDLQNDYRIKWRQLLEQEKNSFAIFETINRNIIDIFSKQIGEEEIATSLQLLEAGQDVAIQIGEMTEKILGENTAEVRYLEEYCEAVYQNCVALQNIGTLDNLPLEKVIDSIEAYKQRIYEQENDQTILILTARADQWNVVDDYYRKLKQDGYKVRVMVLPYYMRDMLGKFTEEHYELESYPVDLDFVNYKQYDIRKEHPWRIVTQLGHDQCNYTWSVNPEYYNCKIKGYTEKLIYISPYIVSDYEPGDSKMWTTMEHFVKIPALVHADQIVVHSDNIRNAYVNYLCEKTGENNCEFWLMKINTSEEFLEQIDKDWKEQEDKGFEKYKAAKMCEVEVTLANEMEENLNERNTKDLKYLMIYFSVGTLCYYEDKAVNKLHRVLDILLANKDKICPVWMLTSEEQHYIKEEKPELYKKIEELQEYLKRENPKAVLWNKDIDSWQNCTAYYGDESPYIKYFRENKKPVMIERLDV